MNEAKSMTPADMLPDDLLSRPFAWELAKDAVGEKFQVVPEQGEPVPLELVEVSEVKPGRFRQFSVMFRGPLTPLLPQRTYRFRHQRLGDFALLITAVGRSENAIDYEACFAHAG